ncbi:hypothetical protein [Pseudovibrio axinellae]|nr:hypothetical protein [Pseudovibrio axinellae]
MSAFRAILTAAVLSPVLLIEASGPAHAVLISKELILPITHYGTAVSKGLASPQMTEHCETIFEEFRGTSIFVDYEVDSTSNYAVAEIAIGGEAVKMTRNPTQSGYKFFSNDLPQHLASLGAQAVTFHVNDKLEHPSVEIRFSESNHYECHLIASETK